MFYLVKETMGRKKLLNSSKSDCYEDDQSFSCMDNPPFDEKDKVFIRTIQIICINAPDFHTEADVYSDRPDDVKKKPD